MYSKAKITGRRLAAAGLAATMAVPALAIVSGSARAAVVRPCYSQNVSLRFGRSSAAAGSTYQRVGITNNGPECTFYGYPGVSFRRSVTSPGQIGAAAQRSAGNPQVVVLQRHGHAYFVVQIASSHNYSPSYCRPRTAGALGFYLPGERAQFALPGNWSACRNRKVIQLHSNPVQPG